MKEAKKPVAIYSTAHNAHHFKVRDRREEFATDIYDGRKRQQPYFSLKTGKKECNGERVIIAARRCCLRGRGSSV